MGISSPWTNSLDIIALHPVKKRPGIDPMGLIDLCVDSLDIIALHTFKINC